MSSSVIVCRARDGARKGRGRGVVGVIHCRGRRATTNQFRVLKLGVGGTARQQWQATLPQLRWVVVVVIPPAAIAVALAHSAHCDRGCAVALASAVFTLLPLCVLWRGRANGVSGKQWAPPYSSQKSSTRVGVCTLQQAAVRGVDEQQSRCVDYWSSHSRSADNPPCAIESTSMVTGWQCEVRDVRCEGLPKARMEGASIARLAATAFMAVNQLMVAGRWWDSGTQKARAGVRDCARGLIDGRGTVVAIWNVGGTSSRTRAERGGTSLGRERTIWGRGQRRRGHQSAASAFAAIYDPIYRLP
ncbi:hypothetical protein BJ912DRAFT_1075371 [Pholiota molesta]|nr:hypothetical protein BJ912DRAFT_1075371 [Pholiota molesta]